MIPVLAPAEADEWDARAEAEGIPRALLMESAGRAAAVVLADRYASVLSRGVLIAAGRGNNGGDGWVLARALHRAGVPVWVASLSGARSPLAEVAASRA
ncbi:MAG TPA: NAD(P)H-hydrate epimerase, partial [Gemmatimonadales bacterium]|nr:NAD(P)H-hydrate epimerase [Gemmatimonadales bacterium]